MIGGMVRRSFGQHGVLGAVTAADTQNNGSKGRQLGQMIEKVPH
jgi:hypothetical protein